MNKILQKKGRTYSIILIQIFFVFFLLGSEKTKFIFNSQWEVQSYLEPTEGICKGAKVRLILKSLNGNKLDSFDIKLKNSKNKFSKKIWKIREISGGNLNILAEVTNCYGVFSVIGPFSIEVSNLQKTITFLVFIQQKNRNFELKFLSANPDWEGKHFFKSKINNEDILMVKNVSSNSIQVCDFDNGEYARIEYFYKGIWDNFNKESLKWPKEISMLEPNKWMKFERTKSVRIVFQDTKFVLPEKKRIIIKAKTKGFGHILLGPVPRGWIFSPGCSRFFLEIPVEKDEKIGVREGEMEKN